MPGWYGNVHVGLERHLMPKMRLGVQIAVIGAALLIFFMPHVGFLHHSVTPRLLWILTGVGALMMVCGVLIIAVLPRYYQRATRALVEERPLHMLVTLREERQAEGAVTLAELRRETDGADDPPRAVVRVMKPLPLEPNSPAQVYGLRKGGPITVQTVHGMLFPAPDESQERLEEALRAEI